MSRLQVTGEWTERALARLREWLRRVMPRVAIASGVLFVLWLLVYNTSLYRFTPLRFFGQLTFLAIAATAIYYGVKSLVRLKRMLLWRVRRRLVITYLFVGLTPIVLLLLFGFFSAIGGSSQAMVRIVMVQMSATERQALENARTVADAFAALPAGIAERQVQTWLDERANLMRASLPGARVSVWRGGATAGGPNHPGQDARANFTSALDAEVLRAVSETSIDAAEPVPAWLEGQAEWSGLAYLPPALESTSAFGVPWVRALVRREREGRAVAVLVTVPISRALVEQFRASTGLNVRPFFLGASGVSADRQVTEGATDANSESRKGGLVFTRSGRAKEVDFARDQFGESLPDAPFINFWYPVFLPATNWETGTRASKWAFMVDWSWREGGRQFWGDAMLGEAWRRGLYGAAAIFFVLELLALLSAAWMTRAVTGMVHKLHRATEFIKLGDFSHRVRSNSHDQLGELAVAFNEMSANIESLLAERVERERLEREVEIAAEVQAQLFPRRVPRLTSAEITGECRAARGVAGDYYDYMEVADRLVAFALGDVSGKGVSASLVMSNLQASLRAQVTIIAERLKFAEQATAALGAGVATTSLPVALSDGEAGALMPCGVTGVDTQCAVSQMTASINLQLCRSTDANRFATLFLALYDEHARLLRYTNAGHNAALLVRAGGEVEQLSTGGVMVGAFEWAQFEEAQAQLSTGDLLVVFSDGISEAQNAVGEEYGENRLTQFVVANRSRSADELRRAIFDEVDKWSGIVERGDDQTLVILKVAGGK